MAFSSRWRNRNAYHRKFKMDKRDASFKGALLTLYNYKLPLRKIPDGHGYYGTLSVTTDGRGVQCHICGRIMSSLGFHINNEHQLSAQDYKKKFQLGPKTALISENTRKVMQEKGLRQHLAHPEIVEEMSKIKKPNPAKGWKKSLEQRNREGTCPDQVLDKIKECKEKLGRQPSIVDFMNFCNGSYRYIHLIREMHGSWNNALRMLGMQPLPVGATYGKPRDHYQRHTKESLIQCLKDYQQVSGKIPTSSDCRRKLIPDYHTFRRHFGSLTEARKAAGIMEKPNRHGIFLKNLLVGKRQIP